MRAHPFFFVRLAVPIEALHDINRLSYCFMFYQKGCCRMQINRREYGCKNLILYYYYRHLIPVDDYLISCMITAVFTNVTFFTSGYPLHQEPCTYRKIVYLYKKSNCPAPFTRCVRQCLKSNSPLHCCLQHSECRTPAPGTDLYSANP